MWTLQHFQQIGLLALEASAVSVLLLILFRLRTFFGLAPLYIVLGSFQYMQSILASSIYIDLVPGIMVSPGSVVLFSANLFALLVVYICEDADEVRKLIYGLVAANLSLSFLTLLFRRYLQDPTTTNFFNLPLALFSQDLRAMILGSATFLADVLLIIIVFEALSRITARFFFLRAYLALAGVLALDTILFVTGCFVERPEYSKMLVSGLVGKSMTALFYAGILALFFHFFDKSESASAHNEGEIKDLFGVLTYRQKFEALRRRLMRDPLTGIFNRRFFDEFLPSELERSQKLGVSTSLLMIDVDHFKQINDQHGHQQGDRVLARIAQILTDCSRSSDAACRFGGEEFAIVMPDADNHAARRLAQRVQERLLDHAGPGQEGTETRGITATIGIATFPQGAETHEDLVELADRRLYAGKKAGRNCIVDATGVVNSDAFRLSKKVG